MFAPFQLLISMATSYPSLGFVVFWGLTGALLFRHVTR